MKWMDGPSDAEMERGDVYEMKIEISSIHFCDTWSGYPFHIDQNSSKNKFRIKIWTFSFQICFWNQFRHRGVVKLKIRKYGYLHNFQFDHFLKSKIYSESRFEMRMSIFLI